MLLTLWGSNACGWLLTLWGGICIGVRLVALRWLELTGLFRREGILSLRFNLYCSEARRHALACLLAGIGFEALRLIVG
jgi:hypothetical protein